MFHLDIDLLLSGIDCEMLPSFAESTETFFNASLAPCVRVRAL